jgi:hypothetical protein
MKKVQGEPSASSASILPVFAQKLTPWPSVDKTRHPEGNAAKITSALICSGHGPIVAVLTSNDTGVNFGVASTELQIWSTVVIHDRKLRSKMEVLPSDVGSGQEIY